MNATIFTPARRNQAFAKVRRNSDCAGADGLTPAVYSLELDARLAALQHAIENGTYQPQPLRAIPLNLPGKKPRRRVARTLLDRGERVQWSLFSCVLTTWQRGLLADKLGCLIDPTVNSVRFYPVRGAPEVACGALPRVSVPHYFIKGGLGHN